MDGKTYSSIYNEYHIIDTKEYKEKRCINRNIMVILMNIIRNIKITLYRGFNNDRKY